MSSSTLSVGPTKSREYWKPPGPRPTMAMRKPSSSLRFSSPIAVRICSFALAVIVIVISSFPRRLFYSSKPVAPTTLLSARWRAPRRP